MKQLLLIFAVCLPAWAQVEKVAMRTTGISCGMCAGLSELSFRRMPGVDKVQISLSKEAILLTFKPGATFDPQAIRKVLQSLEVGVVQFQISARGRAIDEGGKRSFIAGKDQFVITSGELPVETPVLIEAILNDRAKPMELKILNSKPAAR